MDGGSIPPISTIAAVALGVAATQRSVIAACSW
jgi:hypothetical protein